MKLLVITYGYPPLHAGGYEIRCKDVLNRLAARGHDALVITTLPLDDDLTPKRGEEGVYRVLHHKFKTPLLLRKILNDIADVAFIHRKLKEYQPDLVYLWHIVTLSDAIIPYLAKQNIPIVYDVADIGITYVAKVQKRGLYFEIKNADALWRKWLKRAIYLFVRFFSFGLLRTKWEWASQMRVYFNSENVKKYAHEHDVPSNHDKVIYAGVDINIFQFPPSKTLLSPVQILTPGRIAVRKGTLDAVLLLRKLHEKNIPAKLMLVGKVDDLEYFSEIENSIQENGLGKYVTLLSMISQQELAKLYHAAHFCFFPSYHESGLSAVPMEAMACGACVLTYGNENSLEIIDHEKTGFVLPEGDVDLVVNLIQDLLTDRERYEAILKEARAKIEQKYTMDKYVREVEEFLKESIPS